ncbi:MAG: hypothetical protein M3P49_10020 [Actinomycetota bacterium]|nr:hypothetical protein [Actinomycetota bacterium]
MPQPRHLPKKKREEIANAAGCTLAAVDEAIEAPKRAASKHLTRSYGYPAQKKLLDKMLAHMEDSFVATYDSMSLQQFTNSIVQILRLSMEFDALDSPGGVGPGEEDPMDAEAERATNKMLQFGLGRE